jgi:hypothetical protein
MNNRIARRPQELPPMPEILNGSLTVKIGNALGQSRKIAGEGQFRFTPSDVIKGFCKREFNRIRQSYTQKSLSDWTSDQDLYFKPAGNTSQANFCLLNAENLDHQLDQAWRNAHAWRRSAAAADAPFYFSFFIYSSVQAASSTHRITQASVERSRTEINNFLSENEEIARPGPMEFQHWLNSRARNSDQPIEIPQEATSR